jgi:ATP-dependent DNA ligase
MNFFATTHMKAVKAKQRHLDKITPEKWMMEEKFKGIRVWRIQYPDSSIQLLTHGGMDITKNFPHLCLIDQTRPVSSSQLDCELFDPNQEDEIVSGWANRDSIDPSVVEDCVLKVFDILHIENQYLGKLPLLNRKNILKNIALQGPLESVRYQPAFSHDEFYASIVKRGGEGVVYKNIYKEYLEGGRRVDYWLKRKKREILTIALFLDLQKQKKASSPALSER